MSESWRPALAEISMTHREQREPSIWWKCCVFSVHGTCVLLPLLYGRLPKARVILLGVGALSWAQLGVLTGIVGNEERDHANVVAPGGASARRRGRQILRCVR